MECIWQWKFSKMCLCLMSFRAPSAALKQKNYHNSPNMRPIITLFQVLLKFIKRHLLTIVSHQLNAFYLCYTHASFFAFFLILLNFQRHLHSICVCNIKKPSKPLQTRYDTTHIYDRHYIRTHVYVFLFSVKKRVFELSRV